MYNSETGALVRSLNLASESFMFRDTLPLEEDWLVGEPASGGGTHGLVVWNTLSGRVTAQFPEFAWPYNKVAISPDGRRLAIGAPNHLIEIWSLPERRLVHTLRGHQWHVLALGFSPDSRFLATGSWDGDARVWDMVTGEQSAPTLRGHGSGVHGVCFSADGRTLVTAGDDNTVRLWHLATGREMLLLDNARRASLDFLSPDGALLVVWDVTREAVRVSRIPTLAEIDAAEKAQAAASAK
jgi:WD40 repeat protein